MVGQFQDNLTTSGVPLVMQGQFPDNLVVPNPRRSHRSLHHYKRMESLWRHYHCTMVAILATLAGADAPRDGGAQLMDKLFVITVVNQVT